MIAVVIPVRNGESSIAEAVRAVLGQDHRPDELVVVDNGSTDRTAAVARAAGAQVVTEARPGSYAARNTGVAATTAPIVVFTDADCRPEPGWLREIVAAFDADPDVDVVGGPVVAPSAAAPAARWAAARRVLDQARAHGEPHFWPFFATANASWRREALERIGGFDAQLRSGGDVDACWRLQQRGGRLAYAPRAMVIHRHRDRVLDLLAQQHRYAIGHGRLDHRWTDELEYRAAMGSALTRLRAFWLLPARLAWRLVTRSDLAIPLLDAAVRVVHEAGRWRGRRMPPLAPVAAPPPTRPVG